MNCVTKLPAIPPGSKIAVGFGTVDYFDSYRIARSTDLSAKEEASVIFGLPRWAKLMLAIRNRVVGVFGLKAGKITEERDAIFTQIENREDEIVMGENDKHLNFRTSITILRNEEELSLTTVVHFNNAWGRIYFFFVKPFHKMLMRSLLKKSS